MCSAFVLWRQVAWSGELGHRDCFAMFNYVLNSGWSWVPFLHNTHALVMRSWVLFLHNAHVLVIFLFLSGFVGSLMQGLQRRGERVVEWESLIRLYCVALGQ